MPERPPSNRPVAKRRRVEAAFGLALGLTALVVVGGVLADRPSGAEAGLDERLAAAPAHPALWLEKAEREEDPRALRLSVLTGPREPALQQRRRALADRLGQRLDANTRELLK